MTINKSVTGTTLTVEVEGRLDTMTAPELERVLKDSLQGITELIFDFDALAYVSSAGLRVLLSAQKIMNKQGSMVIRNVCEMVMEVFEVTGFSDILTVE
jgi:anti-sigma B factor antagonist